MTRDLASVDPLQRARQAAELALRDRLTDAAPVLAGVAVSAAWRDLKRAYRPRLEDGR